MGRHISPVPSTAKEPSDETRQTSPQQEDAPKASKEAEVPNNAVRQRRVRKRDGDVQGTPRPD